MGCIEVISIILRKTNNWKLRTFDEINGRYPAVEEDCMIQLLLQREHF